MYSHASCSIMFTAGESAGDTSDLLKLDSFHPLSGKCDSRLAAIATHAEWEALLQGHPDQRYVDYILSSLRHGFRIGFSRSSPLRAAKLHMQSALEHPEVVTRYLEEEVKAGRVLGPFSREETDAAAWQISKSFQKGIKKTSGV